MWRIIPLLALLGCSETPVTGDSGTYRLLSINGAPFADSATLRLVGPQQVAGNAPCNSYSGQLARPLPDFGGIEITSTEIACAGLAAEAQFLTTLAAMTRAEADGSTLTFSNPSDDTMVFVQP